MKPDEREFLTAYLAAWRERKARARDVYTALGMHERRAEHILRKIKKYSYGVCFDLGWLDPGGEEEIEAKLSATTNPKAKQ